MATPHNVAWAAGIFEGEGCIQLQQWKNSKVRKRPYPVLLVTMTDLDILQRFRDTVGHGKINGPRKVKNPRHKPAWTWNWFGRGALDWAMENFGPFLGQRRSAKLQEVMASEAAAPYASEGFRRWARRIDLPTKQCSHCKHEKLKNEFSSKSSSWCNTCKSTVEKVRRSKIRQAREEVTAE